MGNLWILAQTDGIDSQPITEDQQVTQTEVTTDPNQGVPTRQKPGFEPAQLIIFGLMAVLMYFILFRGPKKKQQQHKQMLQALKKNDKVRTIGGIYGTIVDIKDDEITLKVDEANNTKIKISASAIGKNLSNE